jgi:hypothetical protein
VIDKTSAVPGPVLDKCMRTPAVDAAPKVGFRIHLFNLPRRGAQVSPHRIAIEVHSARRSVRSACEGPRAINLRGNDVAATPKPRCSSSTNIEDNRFALSRRLARQGYLKLAPPRRIFSGEAFAAVLGNPKLAVPSPVSECTDQLNQEHWHFKN